MAMIEELERVGHSLFKWRSYLPLFTTVLFLPALSSFGYPFGSHFLDILWEVISLTVSFLGLSVRALTVGFAATRTSGRNTTEQVAETLNTSGMYSIVRNPLYLGNFLMVLGVIIFLRVWWIVVIYCLLFTVYYERIIFAEEIFLRRKFGFKYTRWAAKTPAFFPRFTQWERPALRFNWKKVVRREYHGFLGVVGSMFFLEMAGDIYGGYGFRIDKIWAAILTFTVMGYAIIRFFHKRTNWLRTEEEQRSDR